MDRSNVNKASDNSRMVSKPNDSSVVGIDIGGANLKAADLQGRSIAFPFPLWKSPQELASVLQNQISPLVNSNTRFAITMTGELCDCFASKAEGVRSILRAVVVAFPEHVSWTYDVEGRFEDCRKTLEGDDELLTRFAASNWHASASFCVRQMDFESNASDTVYQLFVDCGSTSTDIIPIQRKKVTALGTTDPTRIANHELVYTGVKRSPACAVCPFVTFRENRVPLAAELFADMGDVYLLLGKATCEGKEVEASSVDNDTADGRPVTVAAARHRLARMLCADENELLPGELESIATQIANAQKRMIQSAIEAQVERFGDLPSHFIVAGSGSFLIEEVLKEMMPNQSENETCSIRTCLEEEFGEGISEVFPAYAIANLFSNSQVIPENG